MFSVSLNTLKVLYELNVSSFSSKQIIFEPDYTKCLSDESFFVTWLLPVLVLGKFALSAGVVEYTDSFSAEG